MLLVKRHSERIVHFRHIKYSQSNDHTVVEHIVNQTTTPRGWYTSVIECIVNQTTTPRGWYTSVIECIVNQTNSRTG